MAISDKEAAKQIIDNLPEDATLHDIIGALDEGIPGVGGVPSPFAQPAPGVADNSQPAERRPVIKGYITVLEPTRPLPAVSLELVNYIIERMRREREDRFLGLSEDDG